jgi:hypothetical protein
MAPEERRQRPLLGGAHVFSPSNARSIQHSSMSSPTWSTILYGLLAEGCPNQAIVCLLRPVPQREQGFASRQTGRVQLGQRAALYCGVSTADHPRRAAHIQRDDRDRIAASAQQVAGGVISWADGQAAI